MLLGLLVKIKPQRDESLLGYLNRSAEANGLDGNFIRKHFLDRIETEPGFMKLLGSWNPIWPSVAQDLHCRPAMSIPMWNFRHRRFCGRCLSEKPYWRSIWDLSLVTACERHSIQLCDICPQCGAVLAWDGNTLLSCSICGCSLLEKKSDVPRADANELWLSRKYVTYVKGGQFRRGPHFSQLDIVDFHNVACRLGVRMARVNFPKPLKIANSQLLEVARPIAEAAGSILKNWPSGFAMALNRIRKQRNQNGSWKLRRALGEIYLEISTRLPEPRFQFIRDALEQYVRTEWKAPLAFRNRRMSEATILDHRWQSVRETSVRLELDPAIVRRLAISGQIESQEHKYKSGRIACVVDFYAIRELADELRAALTARDAADLLGLPTRTVAELARSGFLKVWGGIPGEGKRWYFTSASVEYLLKPGADSPVANSCSKTEVPFAYIQQQIQSDISVLKGILTAIVDRQIDVLAAMSEKRRICDWIFDRDQVNKLLEKLQPSLNADEHSIVGAAKIIGIKQEVAYALVRYGTLKCTIRKFRGRHMRIITDDVIREFREEYIFGKQLADILDTSPNVILMYLNWCEIFPVGGPTVKGKECRQYYWKKSTALEIVIEYFRWRDERFGRKGQYPNWLGDMFTQTDDSYAEFTHNSVHRESPLPLA